jgi:hypothetical protein
MEDTLDRKWTVPCYRCDTPTPEDKMSDIGFCPDCYADSVCELADREIERIVAEWNSIDRRGERI